MRSVELIIQGNLRKIYLKLEGENLTGSMKDRTAYGLIQHCEKQGLLKRGESTVVESTSGNLGVALALLCKARGYDFIAVIDPKTTQENINKMQAFGARIEMVHQMDSNEGYLLSRLQRVKELCARSSKYIWTNQYESEANPYAHYTGTGVEIYEQLDHRVDAIFVPVSTGGTLAGIGRFFREVSPATSIIGVDAYGSVIFGCPPAPRKLTGIGSSRQSSFLDKSLYDTYRIVRDHDAFTCCRTFYANTGIKVGGSSGAVLSACIRYLSQYPELERVVCVCADNGENYASTIYNDEWMQQQASHLESDLLKM